MNPQKHYLILVLLSVFSSLSMGQTINEESNWFKEIGRGDNYYSSFDFTRSRYTKADVETAKTRYLTISATKPLNDWEGSYTRKTFLGGAEIIWNRQNGFVYHYVYHTLAALDYGRVVERGDSVWFISDRTAPPKNRTFYEVEYIKIKFGERHLLVPKTKLKDFAIIASGRDISSKAESGEAGVSFYLEDNYYWEMIADEDKPISIVPVYPKRYAYLIRQPIVTNLQSFTGVEIRREKSADGEVSYEQNIRRLTFLSGTKHGIREGMRFWIPDLEEWAEVVSVSSKRSVAELSRPIIEGNEYCDKYENYDVTEFPCRDLKIGMNAHTKTEYF